MYLLSPCSMLNFWNYISHGYFDCMLSSTLVDSVSLFLIFYHYCFFFFYLAQLKIEEITRMLRTGELGIPDNPDERYILQTVSYTSVMVLTRIIC